MYLSFLSTVIFATTVALNAGQVRAESHTIRFENKCGSGTPQLVQNGKILSNGEDFTSNGPLDSGIAYLQTGPCLLNGDKCALVEMTMKNPTCPGCGSSADVSIIPDHELNVESAFSFYGGDGKCDGLGASCADPNCNTAYHVPDDNQVVRSCQSNDVNLLITFCGGKGTTYTDASPNSQSSSDSGSSAPSSTSSTAQNDTATTDPSQPTKARMKRMHKRAVTL